MKAPLKVGDYSMPAEFPGTDEQKEANRRTHVFDERFMRCLDCDCRPWGRVALWPCGAFVPRVDIEVHDA